MTKAVAAFIVAVAMLGAAIARADDGGEQAVVHGALAPEASARVRTFVLNLAVDFGGFYPHAQFRRVRAVYFASGAIIVCGEIASPAGADTPGGWRYFSNSGPLIFESDRLETLCDARAYDQPAFADDHDYAAEFTQAAMR
jgi:hypothetical protein